MSTNMKWLVGALVLIPVLLHLGWAAYASPMANYYITNRSVCDTFREYANSHWRHGCAGNNPLRQRFAHDALYGYGRKFQN